MQDLLIDAAARLSRGVGPLRGRGRVGLLLHRRADARGSAWTITMRRGHRMALPGNSAQSWQAAFTGEYDDEAIDLLVPLIDPGSLVLDVGASLGLYTIPLGLAARRVGARVVAVEPIAENCAVILHNVELNRVQDAVTLRSHALGAAPGEVTLHIESGGAGNATVVTGLDAGEVGRHDRVGNMREAETVQVRPLDDVELSPEDAGRRCSLIKLDVEGFEMDVLDGARAFIARHRPAILGEFNPTWLETRGVPVTAPATWAAENGYACREVVLTRVNPASDTKKASLRPLAATGVRGGTDLLLLPDPSEPPA